MLYMGVGGETFIDFDLEKTSLYPRIDDPEEREKSAGGPPVSHHSAAIAKAVFCVLSGSYSDRIVWISSSG